MDKVDAIRVFYKFTIIRLVEYNAVCTSEVRALGESASDSNNHRFQNIIEIDNGKLLD